MSTSSMSIEFLQKLLLSSNCIILRKKVTYWKANNFVVLSFVKYFWLFINDFSWKLLFCIELIYLILQYFQSSITYFMIYFLVVVSLLLCSVKFFYFVRHIMISLSAYSLVLLFLCISHRSFIVTFIYLLRSIVWVFMPFLIFSRYNFLFCQSF